MAQGPKQIIREEILALAAYAVADARDMVKLDAMENPYPLPEPLRVAAGRIAAGAALNRYPDPQAAGLKARLRGAMRLPDGMDLLLGNGSDEIIQMLCLACARPGAAVLSVEPTFVMFRMIATFAGMPYLGVDLRPDFSLDEGRVLEEMGRAGPALVFLAYPNNPTGNLFDPAAVTRIIERAPGLVVVDEAYTAFAGESFLPALERHPNLLVMRTLSKLGLAGLRLGYLVGRREWLAEIDKLRLPYNVSVLSQQVGEAVLAQPEALFAQAAELRAGREALYTALWSVPGVRPFASRANFILFRVGGAEQVFMGLRARGVLVKNVSRAHPLLKDCLRVTVGTPDENERFLAALSATLAG